LAKPIDTERRLVAIFAADVEGYSRLMGSDEVGTLRDLTQRRAVLDGLIASHRGRIANTAGDSVLAEFASAVDAVQCAVEAQAALTGANSDLSPDRQINFRIGVHVGDIMVKGGDLFGDAVNIAARLQTIASAGGTCISGAAHDQVRKVLPFAFTDLGAQQVKNIEEPIRAFSVSVKGTSAFAEAFNTSMPLALPDKPSIAVLPFQNMSGDPEQEYFADGMVEEIITALSRFKSIFVIARNSSFTYKGKAVDIKQVGRELGVHYVLEGSIRKAGETVRITGQLIDASTGAHIWAEKFDGKVIDVFALQDEVTEKVVAAIEPAIKRAEIEFSARRQPNSLGAYDLYLRALPRLYSMTKEGLDDAIGLAYRALEIDPRYGAAAVLAATCRGFKFPQGWASDVKSELEEIDRLFRLAISVDENDPEALARLGRQTAYATSDYETAEDMADKAVAINPNSAKLWDQRGWVYTYSGKPTEAISSFERAIRLSPLDPMIYETLTGMGFALAALRRFEDAVAVCKRAARQNQKFSSTYRCLASALAQLGRDAEAREAAEHLLKLDPDFRMSKFVSGRPTKNDLYIEGLRMAGLPE
jgi:adenylate cyclase